MTRESELHERIYGRSRAMGAKFPRVVVGPGDDCAVVRTGSDADGPCTGLPGASVELLTVDQVVEDRHFVKGTPVDIIARKVVARSISDIAAMGGTPRWGLATGVLPSGFAGAGELTDALQRWGEHWHAPMVGGDIAMSSPETPLVLTVTVGGVPHGKRGPVLRSGARAGDEVWVTGAFGGSLASGRHLSFEPRVAEGGWLCDALGPALHAMIDVSDGLGRDAGRLARASGVRIEIDGERVPRHGDVTEIMAALRDGEDYELCFVTEAGAGLPARTPQGTALTRIGLVSAPGRGAGCTARIGGREIDASELGWDHGG